MRSTLRVRLLKAASAGAVVLAGSASSASPKTYTVLIAEMKFGPIPSELHQGDAIIWVNRDILRHSATALNGGFDIDLAPGARKHMVLTRTGSFAFMCRYHPGMRGTLKIGQ